MAINVLVYDKGIYSLRISAASENIPRTNLLLIEKGGVQHYTWIKDVNRLLHSQSKNKGRKYFCFTREDLLAQHKLNCKGVNGSPMRTRMPEEDQKILKFINHHKKLKAPYIINADFEALTTKIEGAELDPAKSNTQKTQHHETCGFGYVDVRCDRHTEAPFVYRGSDTATRFLEHISRKATKIKRTLSNPAPMEMTPKDTTTHEIAQDYHMCEKPLNGDSVRDHCNITDKYRYRICPVPAGLSQQVGQRLPNGSLHHHTDLSAEQHRPAHEERGLSVRIN
jgi:hypothetical protein